MVTSMNRLLHTVSTMLTAPRARMHSRKWRSGRRGMEQTERTRLRSRRWGPMAAPGVDWGRKAGWLSRLDWMR